MPKVLSWVEKIKICCHARRDEEPSNDSLETSHGQQGLEDCERTELDLIALFCRSQSQRKIFEKQSKRSRAP